MTSEWLKDIKDMHQKFGVTKWVQSERQSDVEWRRLDKFIQFRMDMIKEELDETKTAIKKGDEEGVVDGLIDLCVFTIGTLDILGLDVDKAWRTVHSANMAKEPGIKASRPNPLGLPDMIKPKDWKDPSHKDNIGIIKEFIGNDK